jgi:hypothetical protein
LTDYTIKGLAVSFMAQGIKAARCEDISPRRICHSLWDICALAALVQQLRPPLPREGAKGHPPPRAVSGRAPKFPTPRTVGV